MKIGIQLRILLTFLLTMAVIIIAISFGLIVQEESLDSSMGNIGLSVILGSGIVIFLVTFFIFYPLAKNLINALTRLHEYLEILAQGKLNEALMKYQGNDEITGIIQSVRQITDNMRKIIESNAQQDWLKTGQAQLSTQLSGEQNFIKLAESIINFLTPYLEAQVGACYLADEDQKNLRMIASYAYTWRKGLANEFQLGESIVGQVALERKMIILTEAPDNYVYIQSGVGSSPPKAILVMPILYEDTLKAVIELASFKVFTEIQLEFLKQVMPSIGTAINTAQSRSRMQSLLRQSESQKEELEIQAEEVQTKQKELEDSNEKLQTQSEYLKKQAEELKEKQEELQQTNETLQNQSEELQVQQEELRQTNEEMEERTKDLEQQRNEISKKNTALKKTQKIVETKAKELEVASKYKSEFLANMSHELRTPLNSLLILAQILSHNKEGNLSEKQVEYAQTMHRAGSDLLTLINEILDLSKVEAGKMETHIEAIELSELAHTVQQKFQHVAEEKGVTFNIISADNLPKIVHTDAQRLQQIINNLLSNAFKFTGQEGEVTWSIQRPPDSEDLSALKLNARNAVMISVIDTGVGIPKEKQMSIFEAFQQVDGTTSRRYGGTGLGLSISRQLARLLGGDIRLLSEENKGSTFTLYLPESLSVPKTTPVVDSKSAGIIPLQDKVRHSNKVNPPKAQPLDNTSNALQPKESIADDREILQPGDKSFLIIEDDREFLPILMTIVREKQFKCLVAEDGEMGLQLAETHKPDAILLDIGLPKIDGWTVMERLKDNPKTRHIPVHFMSASDQSMDAKRMGAIGYLSKPIDMGELSKSFKKIERFIDKAPKNLLIFAEQHQQREILDLVDGEDVKSMLADTSNSALQHLENTLFDCIILDIGSKQGIALNLLEQLCNEETFSQIPVIIYVKRELTKSEEKTIRRCEENLTIKSVKSPERLLDETTLFLHQIEANLPKAKQNMLRMVHDKEAILMGKKVLLIDDDVRNTFALMTFLDSKNMEVVVGNNGKEALELLDKHPNVDIVLMDIMMPEMDGYEAIQHIRAQDHHRKLPIIALTAKAMKGDKAKCIKAGANDYLAKPVDTDKLISLIRVWLYQ